MSRKKYLTLLSIISVLLGAFSSLNAQQVVGTIVDSDGEPIPYVTLTTLASLEKDAETIQIHYTDSLGYVAFDLSEKETAIRATFQGKVLFEELLPAPINGIIDLGKRQVSISNELDEVAVTAVRRAVRMKEGILTFDIKHTPMYQLKGYNAIDYLRRTPRVSQSGDSFLIDGNPAEVRINGQKTNLSGGTLHDRLQALRSDMIERIEVQLGQSADLGSGITGGYINIVLKELNGYTGSLSADLGYAGNAIKNGKKQPAHDEGLYARFVYGNSRVQGFANASVSSSRYPHYFVEREYYFDNKVIKENNHYLSNKYLAYSFNLGASAQLGELHSINGTASYRRAPNSLYESATALEQPITPLLQDILTNRESSSTSFTGEFNHTWHSKDNKYNWLNSLFYMKKKAHATDALRYSTDGNPIKEEQNINDASNQQFYAATQLSTQLTPIWALESGASYTMTKSNTNYSFHGQGQSQSLTDAHSLYEEHLAIIFAQLQMSKGVWSLTGGLKYEHTYAYSRTANKKLNVGQLLPSVRIGYNAGAYGNISLRYSKWLFRPPFALTNSYRTKRNDYLYSVGNPELRPASTHSFGLDYYWKSLGLGLSYSITNDYLQNSYFYEAPIVIVTNRNMPTQHKWTGNLSYSGNITPWWYTSAEVGVIFQYHPKAIWLKRHTQPYADFNNTFTLASGLQLNAGISYAHSWMMQDVLVGKRLTSKIDMKYQPSGSDWDFSLAINNPIRISRTENEYRQDRNLKVLYFEDTAFPSVSFSISYYFGKMKTHSKPNILNMDQYRL